MKQEIGPESTLSLRYVLRDELGDTHHPDDTVFTKAPAQLCMLVRMVLTEIDNWTDAWLMRVRVQVASQDITDVIARHEASGWKPVRKGTWTIHDVLQGLSAGMRYRVETQQREVWHEVSG